MWLPQRQGTQMAKQHTNPIRGERRALVQAIGAKGAP